MYKRYSNQNWIKHLDFIIIDVVVLLVSFFAAYSAYNGNLRMFQNQYYRNIAILLVLLDLLTSVLFNTMHNVLHRGYFQEFVQTVKQVLLVLASLTIILFILKWTGTYSRIIISLTALFHVTFGYLTRLLWKRFVIRRVPQLDKRSMLLV